MKYDILIENLEGIIENWYDKECLKGFIIDPYDGLCDNIEGLVIGIPVGCIRDWKYYNEDHKFPVDGEEEYMKASAYRKPYSLFNNPKRLHLAVHMLQWLRYNNI